MSNIWFTSDPHFGHANIIKYADRPFKTVHEMDETLVENFNKLIKPGDKLYILGDISFTGRDLKEYISRINGVKYFIRGNHDPKQFDKSLFEWVADVKLIKIGERSIFLSHFAHRVWPQSHYGAWHLYGHDHGNLADYGRSTDVGVDPWSFRPVNYDELEAKFKNVEVIHPNGARCK